MEGIRTLRETRYLTN